MIKNVIFDMDGVIVHSEPVILKSAIAALAEWGVHATREDFRDFVGAGEDMFVGGVARKHGVEYVLEMKTRTYDLYDAYVVGNLHVFDDCVALIKRLKAAGVRVALASSADRRKVLCNLNEARLPVDTFDVVLTGDDVTHKKPNPEIYTTAAERLGADPSDCVVVEDAVNGVMAANAAGMRCLAVTTSFAADILEGVTPPPFCVLPDLSGAYAVLEQL